jgi:hypothetical protein
LFRIYIPVVKIVGIFNGIFSPAFILQAKIPTYVSAIDLCYSGAGI